MQPAWHPRGDRLAWIEWDHPQMPWDGTRLVLGQLARSRHGLPSLRTTEVLAGDADTAIAQPCFSPDGRYLVYASDERGYSNLWCRDLASSTTRCLYEDTSDVAGPAWAQGMRAFSWAADSRTLYFVRSENAQRLAYALDFASGAVTRSRRWPPTPISNSSPRPRAARAWPVLPRPAQSPPASSLVLPPK